MRLKAKRLFSAWLLLLVYIPLFTAVSLHVHVGSDAWRETECGLCAKHIQHDGHFDAYGDNIHHCALCQLADSPYLAPTFWVLNVATLVCATVYVDRSYVPRLGVSLVRSTRAPPSFLS